MSKVVLYASLLFAVATFSSCGAPKSPEDQEQQRLLSRLHPINGGVTSDCECFTNIPDCLCLNETVQVTYGFNGSEGSHKLCIEPDLADGPRFDGQDCTPCVSCPSKQTISMTTGTIPGEYTIKTHECGSGSSGKDCGKFCVFGNAELLTIPGRTDSLPYGDAINNNDAWTPQPWHASASKKGEYHDDCGQDITVWVAPRFPGSPNAYSFWLTTPTSSSLGAVCVYHWGKNATYIYIAKCGSHNRIYKIVHKNMAGGMSGPWPVKYPDGLYYWYEYTIIFPCMGHPTVTAIEYSGPNTPFDYTPGTDDLPGGATPTGNPNPPINGKSDLPVTTPLDRKVD